jgi:hypothetical protein
VNRARPNRRISISDQSFKLENRFEFLVRTNDRREFLKPMSAAPFFFQIFLPSGNGGGSNSLNRSVVVEVIPTMLPGAVATGDRDKTERERAEGIARQAAAEIAPGEFESAGERSIAQLGALPDEIGEQPPTLQRPGVRAWLL